MKDRWARLLTDRTEYKKCKNDLTYFYNTYLIREGEPLITQAEIDYHTLIRGIKLTDIGLIHRAEFASYTYQSIINNINASTGT